MNRLWFARSALWLALAFGLVLATTPVAYAQHDDGLPHGDVDHGDSPEEIASTHEHAEHAPATFADMFWVTRGPNGEPPFAGRVLAFAIWLFMIIYFGRKPLAAFLQARRAAIVNGLEEAKRVEAAAHAKHAEYTARIANLDDEIQRLREDFQRAGLEERDRMVAEASARANKMQAEAKFLVDQQLKGLREELTREAIEAAVAAADKILRERATGADQQRLADEYLARLRTSVAKGAST